MGVKRGGKKAEVKKKVNGNGKNNSGFKPKTFMITAAQAIQSEKHAAYYGEDETRGAPNIPLIENMDRYAKMHGAKTMILQMQGMSCDEINLHEYFKERPDVYINKNKLERLRADIERQREKLERRIGKMDERMDGLETRLSDAPDKSKLKASLDGRKEGLENKRAELEARLDAIEDADYFQTIDVTPLNEKIVVADLIVPPQNVDPTTGRLDIAQNKLGKTIVYAHAKQRFKCAPKSVGMKLPRILMTTGAVTHPNYNTTNSRGDEALYNHKYGFIAVDVTSDKRYLARIVPAFKNGTFVDMGFEFRPREKPRKIGVEALVLGDIHYGDHNQTTMDANYEMMDYFKPKNVLLHDAINGHSMNPHEREDQIKRAIAFREGRLDIKNEFEEAYDEFVGKMAKQFPNTQFNFVYSNHSPDFVRRYLTESLFQEEPWNDTPFVSLLRTGLLEEEDVLEAGFGLISLEKRFKNINYIKLISSAIDVSGLPSNVHFLTLEDGMIIEGYQLGVHGHKGINGARGSPRSMKTGYGKIIAGHTHTPEINGDSYTVGTSSIIPLDYAKGQPGTAMPANAVLYENGLVQLLPIIIGDWLPNFYKSKKKGQ